MFSRFIFFVICYMREPRDMLFLLNNKIFTFHDIFTRCYIPLRITHNAVTAKKYGRIICYRNVH